MKFKADFIKSILDRRDEGNFLIILIDEVRYEFLESFSTTSWGATILRHEESGDLYTLDSDHELNKVEAELEIDMTDSEIEFPAVCTVHCPLGPTNACKAHADGLEMIMGHVGTYITRTELEQPANCDNCVNEHRI